MKKRLALFLLVVFTVSSSEARDWTVYLYLNANDGYQEAYTAIYQIQEALKDDYEGRIAVYIDMQIGARANRIIIDRGVSRTDTVQVSSTQIEFLKEGVQRAFCTAQEGNTLLILSGHGTGILMPKFDKAQQKWIYEPDEGSSPAKRYFGERTEQFCKRVEHLMTGKSMLTMGSDSSFLSANDLHELVSYTSSLLDRKLDILGFDSCYMAMVEVAYQLKDAVRYLVASQDCEEKDGWNYKNVIEALGSDSVLRTGKRFIYTYERALLSKGHDRYSLSLLDLESLGSFAQHLDALVKKMITIDNLLEDICCARMALHPVTGLHFYVDLREFLEVLYSQLLERKITAEVESLMQEILLVREQIGLFIDSAVSGPACQALHGCSIYFPLAHIDSSYTGRFVCEHLWMKFLHYFTIGTTEEEAFLAVTEDYLCR